MKLEPPTFTIGQVWFDFVKRLPRDFPHYRRELSDAEKELNRMYQQAPPLTPEQMAAIAQAQMGASFNQQQYMAYPYGYNGNPLGCGIGWPF